MSDRDMRAHGPHAYWPDGHRGGQEDRATAAEREARAVLAETEPDTPWTQNLGVERLQGSGNVHGTGMVNPFWGSGALAEALREFCEKEGF